MEAKTEKLTTTLVSLNWGKTSDDVTILCAITKSGNLHTKTTVRSYLTALEGPSMAVAFVKDCLEEGNVGILSGASISWERTTYPAEMEHERNGEMVILDKEDIIDHIVKVDLSPINLIILNKYLEANTVTPNSLQEKIIIKGFGVE